MLGTILYLAYLVRRESRSVCDHTQDDHLVRLTTSRLAVHHWSCWSNDVSRTTDHQPSANPLLSFFFPLSRFQSEKETHGNLIQPVRKCPEQTFTKQQIHILFLYDNIKGIMLTSTTAPGKTFSSRAELAEHYKSDWHKYNLKRREAGLPLLEEADFQTRWEAALALRKEKEAKNQAGVGHLKHKRSTTQQKHQQKHASQGSKATDQDSDMTNDASTVPPPTKKLPAKLVESQENPTIDPKQSLFDNHMSETLEDNVKYMSLKFGFFIPDRGKCFFLFLSLIYESKTLFISQPIIALAFSAILKNAWWIWKVS